MEHDVVVAVTVTATAGLEREGGGGGEGGKIHLFWYQNYGIRE